MYFIARIISSIGISSLSSSLCCEIHFVDTRDFLESLLESDRTIIEKCLARSRILSIEIYRECSTRIRLDLSDDW